MARAPKKNTRDPWYLAYRNYGEEQIRRTYVPTYEAGFQLIQDNARDDKTAWMALRKNPDYRENGSTTNE